MSAQPTAHFTPPKTPEQSTSSLTGFVIWLLSAAVVIPLAGVVVGGFLALILFTLVLYLGPVGAALPFKTGDLITPLIGIGIAALASIVTWTVITIGVRRLYNNNNPPTRRVIIAVVIIVCALALLFYLVNPVLR